jgi:hypothetical protein
MTKFSTALEVVKQERGLSRVALAIMSELSPVR